MADFVFNVAKGKVRAFCELPESNDALVIVPLAASGIEGDAGMRDRATLAAVLAQSTEQTALGRKTVTAVTTNVDNAADEATADFADIVYAATSGAAVAAILVCYDNNVSSGTDANIVPLTKHDVAFTPDGLDVTVTIPANGFYGAT